jgi:proteasome lid subunit RPN8/RPN11
VTPDCSSSRAPPRASARRSPRGRQRGLLRRHIDEDGPRHGRRASSRAATAAPCSRPRDAEPGSLVLHNHPSGDLTPSDADLAVAAELYAAGLGLAIVDNDATRSTSSSRRRS